ncbi:MAG: hypothetical protein WBB07_12115 [Mycobacterium sp.]
MTLTIADVECWDAGDVREVFHAASSRAQAVQDAANGLATLPAFVTWGGEAAAAAKEAIGRTRADLNAHDLEALTVANAARSAADEIERIKVELATLKSDAAVLGMEIDPVSGRVVATAGFAGSPIELLLKQEQLQPRVDKLISEANVVDIALANAIDMAGGMSPSPGSSATDHSVGGQPEVAALTSGGGGGPVGAPGQMPAPEQAHSADVTSSGAQSPPTSLRDLLGQPASSPTPIPLNPRAVDEFKSVAREVMKRDGVPADQIEQCLNEIVSRAQQPLPDYVSPPEPGGMPAPGFGEGFGDRWFATEQLVKDLTGQEGMDALQQSWVGVAEGLHKAVVDPIGSAIGEVQNALDSPSAAYYLGEKAADGVMSTPALIFGGEAVLARTALTDLDAPEDFSHHSLEVRAPQGFDGSAGDYTLGHGPTHADVLPFELGSPLDTSRPEFTMPNPLDHMGPELVRQSEQYLTGSGETVLGPFAPANGGDSYIQVAQERGSSYFDLGDDWYSYTPSQQLAANQHVLDSAISNGDTIKLSVPFYEIRPDTYTGAELRYIMEHGYQRVDDTTFVPSTTGR